MPSLMHLIGIARPVRTVDLPGLERLLGPTTLLWRDGTVRYRGAGESAVLSGPSAAEVLEAASRSTVHLTGDAIAPPAPWFCGFAFDAGAPRDAWWESFPAARAFLPRLLLAVRDGAATLTAFEPVGADGEPGAQLRAEQGLQAMLSGRPPVSSAKAGPGQVELREDGPAWESLVEQALASLREGMLRKVVLARPLDLTAEAPFDVDRALERAGAGAGVVVYAVRGPDGTTFFGASPERLVRVQGRRFLTQALAGSASPAEADRLRDPKEVREHGAVVEDVRAALDAVAEQLEVAEVSEVALGYVTHLDARIEGTLRTGVTAAEVALALHPTAAVGGAPRDRARAFLRAHERLARGWYAGAVGWIGPEAADLRVALRCALVRGRAARIFVGAGVVEGSTPAGEWAETRRKAGPMLEALLGETPWPR